MFFPENTPTPRAEYGNCIVSGMRLQMAKYYCARSSKICRILKPMKCNDSYFRHKSSISYMMYWFWWNPSAILGKMKILLESSTQTTQPTLGAIIIDVWHAAPNRNCQNASKSPNTFICRLKISERALIMRNLRPARRIFNVLCALLMLCKWHHWSTRSNSKTHIFTWNFAQTAQNKAWLLNG